MDMDWTHTSFSCCVRMERNYAGVLRVPRATSLDLELSFDGPFDLQWRWRSGEMGSFRVASA